VTSQGINKILKAPTPLALSTKSLFKKNYFNNAKKYCFHLSPYFELKAMEFFSRIVVTSQCVNKNRRLPPPCFVYEQLFKKNHFYFEEIQLSQMPIL
jgi:hypothetical protein